ncbi:MAG: diguanylate cyclase [Gammaproteobacteria bacterium]
MELHTPTLVLVTGLVTLVASIALFINWIANRHVPGLLKIAIGYVLNAVGLTLLSQQEYLHPALAVVMANGTVLFGRILIILGLAEYWKQEDSKLPGINLFVLASWLLGYIYFTFINDSMSSRIALYTPVSVFINLCAIYILFNGIRIERGLRPVMSATAHYGAYLLIVMMVLNSLGETTLAFMRDSASLMEPDLATGLLFLGIVLSVMIFPFAIIIMTMEELSVEHEENAIYDPITTILNKRTFLEVGQRIMGVALRYSKPVSLLTIEVINMQQIVEKHGHQAGNKLLRHFSLLANDRRRNEDVLARTSFKDFRLMLPGVAQDGAQVVVEKISKANKESDFEIDGKVIEIDFLVSAITRKEEELNLQQMLQDGELELAKLKSAHTGQPILSLL